MEKNAKRYFDVVKSYSEQTLHVSKRKIIDTCIYNTIQLKVGSNANLVRALQDNRDTPSSQVETVNGNSNYTIALTARSKNDTMMNQTYNRLKELGYKFVDSITLLLKNIQQQFAYHQNIIFTNGGNKGLALKSYLENIDSNKFAAIIFVDDTRENIADVANVFLNMEKKYILHTYWMNAEYTNKNNYYTLQEYNLLEPNPKKEPEFLKLLNSCDCNK